MWVKNLAAGVSVSIKVNDKVSHYFQTKKGLYQGDPLSPVLFNNLANMLDILIECQTGRPNCRGSAMSCGWGIYILQYAYDTIFVMKHYLDKARNLKLLLSSLEKMPGLKN